MAGCLEQSLGRRTYCDKQRTKETESRPFFRKLSDQWPRYVAYMTIFGWKDVKNGWIFHHGHSSNCRNMITVQLKKKQSDYFVLWNILPTKNLLGGLPSWPNHISIERKALIHSATLVSTWKETAQAEEGLGRAWAPPPYLGTFFIHVTMRDLLKEATSIILSPPSQPSEK